MNLSISKPIQWIKKLSLFKKLIIVVIILVLAFAGYKLFGNKNQQPTYTTSAAEKGSLITSISGSGSISSGNSVQINTKASGTVITVYVNNGDTVTKGQQNC